MGYQWDKTNAGGGEGIDDNALSIEYFQPLVAGGGEGIETNSSSIEYLEPLVAGIGEGIEPNLFGSEYLDSLAPVFSDGSGDYGIWTSLPEVPRKKKAA
jgi:hypothetical protein